MTALGWVAFLIVTIVRRLRPQGLPGKQPIYWFLRRPERFGSAFQDAQRLDAIVTAAG